MRLDRCVAAILLLALCQLLRAAPISDGPTAIVTRQAAFSIPFTVPATIDPAAQSVEVRLLATSDGGRSWNVADKRDLTKERLPHKSNFTFRAAADGDFGFAIRTVDSAGRMRPEHVATELRVVVDTRNPRLDLAAERGPAGEIIVRWQIVDPTLKPESLKLEYRSTGNPVWRELAVSSPRGQANRSTLIDAASWWPADASGIVTVKAEVSDQAGNIAIAQSQLDLDRRIQNIIPADDQQRPPSASIRGSASIANSFPQAAAPIGTDPPPANPFSRGDQWPVDSRTDLPLGRTSRDEAAQSRPQVRGDLTRTGPIEGPALTAPPGGLRTAQPQEVATPREPIVLSPANQFQLDRRAAPVEPQRIETPTHPPVGSQFASPTRGPLEHRSQLTPINDSRTSPDNFTAWNAASPGQGATNRPSNLDFALPPGEQLRMVNSRTFELDYDVDAIGRSGIAKVELWATRDGGRAWSSMGVDTDNRSPYRTTVEAEGVYGYRITVQSGSGLGGRPPQPGDLPEVWIGVDLTQPTARLISAEAGTGDRAGEIIIRYEANDSMLAARPVTLQFSTQPGGRWTTIASGLDNSGSYSWRFDSTVPDRVYLRLEVRDEAGNVAAFEAADPISLDRVLPQGRLRNVRPIGESARANRSAQILRAKLGGRTLLRIESFCPLGLNCFLAPRPYVISVLLPFHTPNSAFRIHNGQVPRHSHSPRLPRPSGKTSSQAGVRRVWRRALFKARVARPHSPRGADGRRR